MLNIIVRRLAMTLVEVIAESVFLGILFWLALLPGTQLPDSNALAVLLVSPAPVMLVLFLWGYYFTRPIVGLLGRVSRTWVYGFIAAGLFAVHMFAAIVALWPDANPAVRPVMMRFLIGGTAIVFGCAFFGDRLLRRWMRIRSIPTGVLSSESAL